MHRHPIESTWSRLRSALCIVIAGLMAACAPFAVPDLPPPATNTPGFEDAHYRRAQEQGASVWPVLQQQSLIRITVHRGGRLAQLGHDHVVASRTIDGFVAPQLGHADFHFRLDQLSVDETLLRAEAGFDTVPSNDAIAGTRNNMLTKVLDAQRFPLVHVHATPNVSAGGYTVAITMHGVTRTMEIAARTEKLADGMVVSGAMQVNQSDFGIVPFSVLGGAIAVQDRLDLGFRIVAQKR